MQWLWPSVAALLLVGCASALRWSGDTPQGYYEVRRGDTLYSIALRHDLDFRMLARWNNIDSRYTIHPGQQLRLSPPGGSQQVASRTPPAQAPQPDTRPATPPARRPTAPAPAMPEMQGDWRWPVRGELVRRFAPPDSKGIDIAAAVGTPVLAAAGGRVVYSGSALKGYGELIIVKHDDTWLSAYGYNRRRLVEEGDTVAAGDAIGEVGLGPAQRPMLHFEIRKAGQPSDPLRWLPRSE